LESFYGGFPMKTKITRSQRSGPLISKTAADPILTLLTKADAQASGTSTMRRPATLLL
jgi:hypothetical protein